MKTIIVLAMISYIIYWIAKFIIALLKTIPEIKFPYKDKEKPVVPEEPLKSSVERTSEMDDSDLERFNRAIVTLKEEKKKLKVDRKRASSQISSVTSKAKKFDNQKLISDLNEILSANRPSVTDNAY